jgi:hypothetical protein
MPLLESITAKVTDRLPTMFGSRAHALVECGIAGGFLLFALSAWKRDKRVAVSSAGCGLFTLVNSALTDYSEHDYDKHGEGKLLLDAHARIDIGLAAMIGTIPSFMGLKDKYDARFFRFQAAAMAALAGLTDFDRTGERKQLLRIEKGKAQTEGPYRFKRTA